MNESDFNPGFKVRSNRRDLHLGRPLISPDGRSIVQFRVESKPKVKVFVCTGEQVLHSEVIQFDENRMRALYGNEKYDA